MATSKGKTPDRHASFDQLEGGPQGCARTVVVVRCMGIWQTCNTTTGQQHALRTHFLLPLAGDQPSPPSRLLLALRCCQHHLLTQADSMSMRAAARSQPVALVGSIDHSASCTPLLFFKYSLTSLDQKQQWAFSCDIDQRVSGMHPLLHVSSLSLYTRYLTEH